jgi:hypothetical protein
MTHKIQVFFGILLSLFIFSSCMDDDDVQPTAYGDVIVKTIIRNDSVVYGINFFTYSYTQMESVTANRYGETEKVILDSLDYRYTFSYTPKDSEYSAVKPQKGTFIFNAIFHDNILYTASDYLDSTFLSPPVIKKLSFNIEEEQFKVEWQQISNADAYRVMLIDDDNDVAFQSELLYPTVTQLLIEANSSGWLNGKHPSSNKVFKVVISAYLYETIASSFDLQSISINDTSSVTWMP